MTKYISTIRILGPEMQHYLMQFITVKCVLGLKRVEDSLSRRVKCKMLWKKRNVTIMTACNEKKKNCQHALKDCVSLGKHSDICLIKYIYILWIIFCCRMSKHLWHHFCLIVYLLTIVLTLDSCSWMTVKLTITIQSKC